MDLSLSYLQIVYYAKQNITNRLKHISCINIITLQQSSKKFAPYR